MAARCVAFLAYGVMLSLIWPGGALHPLESGAQECGQACAHQQAAILYRQFAAKAGAAGEPLHQQCYLLYAAYEDAQAAALGPSHSSLPPNPANSAPCRAMGSEVAGVNATRSPNSRGAAQPTGVYAASQTGEVPAQQTEAQTNEQGQETSGSTDSSFEDEIASTVASAARPPANGTDAGGDHDWRTLTSCAQVQIDVQITPADGGEGPKTIFRVTNSSGHLVAVRFDTTFTSMTGLQQSYQSQGVAMLRPGHSVSGPQSGGVMLSTGEVFGASIDPNVPPPAIASIIVSNFQIADLSKSPNASPNAYVSSFLDYPVTPCPTQTMGV